MRNAKAADLDLVTNKDDSSGIKIDINPAQATKKAGDIAPEWAGDLVTTEEELENFQGRSAFKTTNLSTEVTNNGREEGIHSD